MERVLLIVLFLASGNACALEFTVLGEPEIYEKGSLLALAELIPPPTIYLEAKGRIENGDHERFVELLRSLYAEKGHSAPFYLRVLAPEGGDVVEAIKLARTLTQLHATVQFAGGCNSACFFVYLGAVERYIQFPIGVHRPYFDRSSFKGLNADQADSHYKDLMAAVREVLRQYLVPEDIVEKMFRTPSNELTKVSEEDLRRIPESPGIDEWLLSKCGSLPPTESRDLADLSYEWVKGKLRYENYYNLLSKKQEAITDCRRSALHDAQIDAVRAMFAVQ